MRTLPLRSRSGRYIRFKCCDRFYACILCHQDLAGHTPIVWTKQEREIHAIFCGNCRRSCRIEDDDTFFWMRAFPDVKNRKRMRDELYEGKLWKEELEGKLMPILEKYDVVVVEAKKGLGDWRSFSTVAYDRRREFLQT